MGTVKRIFLSIMLVIGSLASASSVGAVSSAATIVINEVQTESLTDSNQEFVELFNVSTSVVDISGWTLQYRAASGTSWQTKATLGGVVYPGGSIVVATQGYVSDIASFFWAQTGGALAATGGNIRVLPANAVIAEDVVAWGTGLYGEVDPATKAPKGGSIERKVVRGIPQDTDNNLVDFEVLTSPSPTHENKEPVAPEPTTSDPTPVSDPVPEVIPTEETPVEPVVDENTASNPATPETNTDPAPPLDTSTDPGVEPIDPPTPELPPVESSGDNPENQTPEPTLAPLVINELMINPSSPLTDAADEWVELYNPNDSSFALLGYKVQTGGTFSHSYTFVDGTIEPQGYYVLYSSISGLQLSNTSGAVRVMNPEGMVAGEVVTYDETEEGNTYALNTTQTWSWTTTPTPERANEFTILPELIPKVTVPKAVAKSSTKTTKSASTKSTTQVKAATASTTKKSAAKTAKDSKASVPKSTSKGDTPEVAQTPSHPVALAGFMLLAVGYALYEYREDITNKMRLTKRYLEARRSRGAGV